MVKSIYEICDGRPIKFERIYEDDETISIWKYDLKKFQNGPIEVETKYKRGYIHPTLKNNKKYIKDLIKEQNKNATKK